ncbi:MAG: pilus assembly protein TadG-related protein [Aeromicrobium sp.]
MSRRRDERGAIFPMTVVMMGVILLIASLVIDIGGDRLVRRDMQSTADIVALDVVRQLDGRAAGAYTGFDASGSSTTLLVTAKNESLGRQDSRLDHPDSVGVRLAVADKNTGAFLRWAASGDVPNAVRVYTTGSSAFRFLSTTPRRTSLQRSALAVIGPPVACISVGATFADVTPQGPLDTLLGKLVGVDRLTVLDPYGLASLDLEIPLADLATQLHVGSVDQIVTAQVSPQDFVLAISEILPHKGNSSNVSLLDAISNGLPDNTILPIADILKLDIGGSSAADVSINTFTLLQSVIMVSNKNHFIDINLTGSIPGLSHVAVQAKVVEAPQIACGPIGTTARSAQIQIKVSADVTALSGLVATASIDPVFVTAADGSATITNVQCTAGGTKSVSVSATTSAGKVGAHVLTDLLLKLTHLVIDAPDPAVSPNGASIGSNSNQSLNFTFGATDIPPGQTAGASFGSLGLSSITPIKIALSGLNVGGLLDSVVKPLLGIIDPLVSNLVRPMFENMGISIGTVRVQPTSRPACNNPLLRD